MSNRNLVGVAFSLIFPTLAACNGGESESESESETGGDSQVGDLVDIPAGDFQMGCDEMSVADCTADELPIHLVSLSAFQIDRTEVTVAAYRECVDSGACTAPDMDVTAPEVPRCNWDVSGREQHPVNCLIRAHAIEYCAFRERRLPTEAEWEYAARGQTGRLYPWGEASPSCDLANTSVPSACEDPARTLPVGSNPDGASAFGVEDMGGNVLEMVSDWYRGDYYAVSPQADPQGPSSGDLDPVFDRFVQVATRGGRFSTDDEAQLRASDRAPLLEETSSSSLGFRCARSNP